MASRHDIIHIDFEANAAKASPALKALRDSAKETSDKIDGVKKKLEELGKSGAAPEIIAATEKELKELNKEFNAFQKAEKELVKGVDMLSKGIEAFNNGSLEQMSAQFQKAVQNAARLNRTKISPDTTDGKKSIAEMDALITATEKNLVKSKQDFAELVKTIESGGQTSVAELNLAKQSLKELSDLTAKGSDEWKGYRQQLATINRYVEGLSETERRLAGEVVTVEDAMKRANTASREEAEHRAQIWESEKRHQALRREQAEQQTQLSKTNVENAEREVAATKEQIDAQKKLISSIRALEDAEDKAEAETSAAETALRKQREETGRFSDAAFEAAKKVGELENKLVELNKAEGAPQGNPTLEQLKKDIAETEAQLSELRRSLNSTGNTGELASDFAGIISSQGVVSGKSKKTKVNVDSFTDQKSPVNKRMALGGVYHDESGYGVATDGRVLLYDKALYDKSKKGKIIATHANKDAGIGVGDEIKHDFPNWRSVSTDVSLPHSEKIDLDALSDFLAGVNEREKAAWKQAKESGETKDTLKDWLGESSVVMKLPDGQYAILGTATLTQTVNAAKEMGANQMSWGDERRPLHFTGERGGVVVMPKRERNEDRRDWAYDMGGSAQSVSPDETKAKIAQLEKEIEAKKKLLEATKEEQQTAKSAADTDKQRAEIQQQLAEAQQKLADAKKATEEPTRKLEQAEKDYADAQQKEVDATAALAKAKGGMNIGEEEDKLDALEKKHQELAQAIDREKQSIEQQQAVAKQAADEETHAAIETAQAQNQSQEAIEQSIAVLEKAHKATNDGTQEYEDQAEAIAKLKQRLAEMRGEAMSLADAQQLAGEAGTKGFIASPEQLQKATAAIERRKKQLQETIQLQRRSGAATDAEEKELKDLEIQLKKLKMEQDNFNMSHKRMDELLKQPTNAKNLDELRSAVKRAKAELNAMEDSLGKNSDAYKNMAANTKKAEQQLKEMEAQAKGTASAFEKAWSRLKTYVGLYVGAAVAMQKLTATMGDLMELSDKMGEVRKTTGFTADEVGRLTGELKKLDTRSSIVELLNLSAAAGQLGLKSQQEVQGFTEAANQLIVALPEMGRESATSLMKIANATGDLEKNGGDVRETLEKVGSTIIALRANSASAAPAITDFVSRVGAVGSQAGISIDQIAALGSTIDALGGRVEMSATALSRMIPAIRNNAFGIANAIGVTEKTLKDLFNQGKTMEAMVLIFEKMRESVKNFDTSTEEGMNAMADNVEALLGKNASMAEVMKELNQQGARAGIVFGLMSQNVDELKRQLGIASEAYKENTALFEEYSKMNETTAAKWERLKNQIDEIFVGDTQQRALGWIIDGLRSIVDFLTGRGGISASLQVILVYLGVLRLKLAELAVGAIKSIWIGIKNIGVALGFVKGQLQALQMANIITAIAAAIMWTVYAFQRWREEAMAAAREAARFEAELQKEQAKVDGLTKAVGKASVQVDDARKKVEEARKALDEARKSTDGSRESTERLSKAEKDLINAESELRKAQDDHSRSVQQINSQYGKYLGFMLSEVSSAAELAAARELINDKLRETITLKRKEAALGRVEESMGEGRDNAYANLSDYITRTVVSRDANGNSIQDPKKAQRIMTDITKAAQQDYENKKDFEKVVYAILSREGYTGDKNDAWKSMVNAKANIYYAEVQNIRKKNREIERQFEGEDAANREQSQKDLERQYKTAEENYTELEAAYANAIGKARQKAAADLLKQMDTISEMIDNSSNYYDLNNEDEKASYNRFMDNSEERIKGMKSQREALLKEAGEAYQSRNKVGGGTTNPNPVSPYGTYDRVKSDYGEWDADSLVARRKEMLERVRALANGADVQKVLSEDAKFITEATRQNIKTTKDAIEWYNTERLKIQDALHEKHLTNTGDWMDPKKAKGRKKLLHDEWRAYLEELDAYYTERKTRIQEAGTEEGITEAEVKNRTLANEMEWHQRRAELQKLYADKSEEVTKEEQQAIFDIIAERTEDSSEMVEKTIAKTVKFMQDVGKKSPTELSEALAKLGLGWERDLLKQQQAVTQQMKAIRDIIEKERPYDGITRNLRENLVTMGILTADMTAERNRLMKENADMTDFNTRQASEEVKRTAFILKEAENAYSTTIEEVMRHMGEQGMQAWADAIRDDKNMQQALMAQLRTAYDEIQNAIKKEAALIKKQTDIWWADIAPGQEQSRRDGFEKMLSQLGLAADQVKRANQLIGAGQASERVADKLAIRQMNVRLAMQQAYYAKMRQIGEERIRQLEAEGKMEDAAHLRRSLNLAKTEELKKLEEQRVAIANQMEEAQNRLYTELKSWAELLSSSLQSVFEASHAGDKEYYNELAKLNLTGKGGPGAGTYVVIDNAGTSDAAAHYEHLSEREALERQHEIELENAKAEAWKKVMDDINMKMSETITDQLNAMLQNASIDANTDAENANTEAIIANTEAILNGRNSDADTSFGSSLTPDFGGGAYDASDSGASDKDGKEKSPSIGFEGLYGEGSPGYMPDEYQPQFWDWKTGGTEGAGDWRDDYLQQGEAHTKLTEQLLEEQKKIVESRKKGDQTMTASSQSMFAKMTQAANLYGIAYQTMSNDNLSAEQKFAMIAVQAAGNAAISMLTAKMSETTGSVATDTPAVMSKLWKQLGWAAIPVFAIFTGLLGGLMGLAVSKIAKSKSEIASATGASHSVASGRLATGMLTYAEGNVNEFTDPSTLTPGRSYNVDGADGKTYRARYTGKNPKTHITNGPEFHLVGEAGREAIIDAKTTRLMQMDNSGIWQAIQTLYNGGRLSTVTRRRRAGRGMPAFAEGNLEDFEEMMNGDGIAAYGTGGMTPEQTQALQASLDRNSEVLERALTEGIKGVFDVYGKGGLVDSYDSGKKTLNRYGQKY